MERQILLCENEVIMHKHQINRRQKARSRLCAAYINGICVY